MDATKPNDHRPRVAAQRRERMHGRLLEAALFLAARDGMQALTIEGVVAQAGVARGSFYKYFDSPASLQQALAIEVSAALISALHPLAHPLNDPAERIAVGMRSVLHLVRTHPLLGNFLIRSGWPALHRDHSFFTVVGVNFDEGILSGRFAKMHPDVGLNLLAGSLVGAMYSLTTGPMPEDFPEQTAAAMMRALGLAAREADKLVGHPLPAAVIDPLSVIGRLMDSNNSASNHGP